MTRHDDAHLPVRPGSPDARRGSRVVAGVLTAGRATADIIRIGELERENERLALNLANAEAQLRLYKAELHNAECLRWQLLNEVVALRMFGQGAAEVVIPIREVVA